MSVGKLIFWLKNPKMFGPCDAVYQVPIMLQQLVISEVCVIKQEGRPREELSEGGDEYFFMFHSILRYSDGYWV